MSIKTKAPVDDVYLISPHNISTLSNRKAMRLKEVINKGCMVMIHHTKFSTVRRDELIFQGQGSC